tara:strand:+ start:9623 stop:12553 length:2931 start_codon:yes stop_codon:yes gene_type:complete
MGLSILAKLGMDSSEFKKGLGDASRETSSFGKKITSAITSATKIAGAALAGMAIKGTMDMVKFQKGISEVFTLLPGISKASMGKMEDDVRELARSMGLDLNDAVQSLYQAISAGVDPGNAIDFLKTSAKTAIGGVASLEDTVGALTTVINGYGMSMKEASRVSDVLFSVVKNGVTNMTELGQNIGKVTPIAASLGVTIEEVGAMFAVLTKQMGAGKTAEAGTAIRSMLAELAKAGQKANENFKELGKGGFTDFIKNGGEVGEALMMMQESAEASGKTLMDMFSSIEAGNGALMLVTNSGKELSKQLQNVKGDAGATETAFATMEQTVSRQIDKLFSNLKEMGLQIGEAFLPVLIDILPKMAEGFKGMAPALASIGEAFADVMLFVASFGKEIASSVGFMIKFALVAKSMMVVVGLAKGLRSLVVALNATKVAQVGVNTAMAANPIGLVVGAVALLVTGIMELISANDKLSAEQEKKAKEWRDGILGEIDKFAQNAKDATEEAKELAKAFADLKAPKLGDFELPLEETRDLVFENEKLLSHYENQRKAGVRSIKRKGEEIEQLIKQKATINDIGEAIFRNIEHEKTYKILLAQRKGAIRDVLKANLDIAKQKEKLVALGEREKFLAEQHVKMEQDIAKAIKATREEVALTNNEAGKIVILGRQIRDLELAKKKIIDQTRGARVLETAEAIKLRDVEADIINKRKEILDIVKNKLKQARGDELQAVKDIVAELEKALDAEKDRAKEAQANAEAKEKEVEALRDNLKDAQKALEEFKKFFDQDIKGKLKIDVGELRKEFKDLKEAGKLPDNVKTLKDFEDLMRMRAGEALKRRNDIIQDGKLARAEAEVLRDDERDALEEQKRIAQEIKETREEAIALEEKIEDKKIRTLEEMTKERKALEKTLLGLQDINVLPMFDATIVEAIETQAENLKALDHNVAALAGKGGAIKVDLDLDDTDITKEETQVKILETVQGYFVNQ